MSDTQIRFKIDISVSGTVDAEAFFRRITDTRSRSRFHAINPAEGGFDDTLSGRISAYICDYLYDRVQLDLGSEVSIDNDFIDIDRIDELSDEVAEQLAARLPWLRQENQEIAVSIHPGQGVLDI